MTCPNAPAPTTPTATHIFTKTVTPAPNRSHRAGASVPPIVEEFDSDQSFIQTGQNVYIDEGRVKWYIERSGGKQYVYRSIPPFEGNVRLTVNGQVDDWTNNCWVEAGIGDALSSGLAITFGFTGGGCPANGPLVDSVGVALDR